MCCGVRDGDWRWGADGVIQVASATSVNEATYTATMQV